jgi:hypothetical protein
MSEYLWELLVGHSVGLWLGRIIRLYVRLQKILEENDTVLKK